MVKNKIVSLTLSAAMLVTASVTAFATRGKTSIGGTWDYGINGAYIYSYFNHDALEHGSTVRTFKIVKGEEEDIDFIRDCVKRGETSHAECIKDRNGNNRYYYHSCSRGQCGHEQDD